MHPRNAAVQRDNQDETEVGSGLSFTVAVQFIKLVNLTGIHVNFPRYTS